ncbi:tetratricopeptide repeat protein [Streptomyces yaizuensis]|nr:tetratricopeptide repeat protein [Streptomyces sp. YSPA8]
MGALRPNQGLQRLFMESGWTLRQFAMAVNRLGTEQGTPLRYREVSVHQWLRGSIPKESVRPLVVEALARRLNRTVTRGEAGFPELPKDSGPRPGSTAALIELGTQDMLPSRRGILGVTLFSVALNVPEWPEVVGRMEAVQSGTTRRIGMKEVEAVRAMTEHFSKIDDLFGGRYGRPSAAAFLVNVVAPCLRAEGPDAVRKAMTSAASGLCYLAGYMAVDEGLQGLAQRYYLSALDLAGAAEDHLAFCTTLRGMSVQAVELGHGRKALRLADSAAAALPKAGPRMRAFLAGQQAHAAAQNGDRVPALKYLQEAEIALEKSAAQAQEFGFGSYNSSYLHYHTGQVRFELGDVAGSVRAMEESDQVRESAFRRSRVRHRAILAERQLQIGHLEKACHTWHLALDDYPSVDSGRVDERIRFMFASLRPYLRNPAARQLHERGREVASKALAA